MKKFPKNKQNSEPVVEETITDALLGTGEHMCTCAALVADIIVEQGQAQASVRDLLKKVQEEDGHVDSATEKEP
jgi:hypothetical protein